MGKRTGQLAGLAALGALGYMMSRDKGGKNLPAPSAAAAMEEAPREIDRGDDRDIGGGFNPSAGPMRAAAPRVTRAAPVADNAATDEVPGAGAALARFQQETAGMSPALAQGRAPMTRRQPTTQTYKRTGGPEAGEVEAYMASRAAARNAAPAASAATPRMDNRPDLSTPEGRRRAEQEQAIENVYPEQYFVGGPGIKTVAALAKGLANRGGARVAESTAPYLKELAAPTRALPAPVPRLPAYKKGGAVKAKPAVKKMASGGMTSKASSASKRADGIAQRGKTRGKLY